MYDIDILVLEQSHSSLGGTTVSTVKKSFKSAKYQYSGNFLLISQNEDSGATKHYVFGLGLITEFKTSIVRPPVLPSFEEISNEYPCPTIPPYNEGGS